jgi:hypothetical protein
MTSPGKQSAVESLLPSGRTTDEDAKILAVRAEILLRIARARVTPAEFFGGLIRRATDEVLTLNKKRWSTSQLESPEKTYIGTRVEILAREALDVGAGKRADTVIAGQEVDLKWSKSLVWMIGPENLGTVCLGIGTTKDEREFSVGLFVPRADLLGSQNRDKKYSANVEFRASHVTWLVEHAPLPPNFIATLPATIRDAILSQGSAQQRMRKLAELVPETPIPRSAIVFVSLNKDDPLRRTRSDAARSTPPLGDMVCLSERYGKSKLEMLGVTLPKNHFFFVHRDKVR